MTTNYNNELIMIDKLPKQMNFNTIKCALCSRSVDLPKYIDKNHTCNNNYCERCINTLHNKCFDCFMPISKFFNKCDYSEVKPKKYCEFNPVNDNIKEKINKSIEEYNKENNIELECDICCSNFFKDNDLNVYHTCTTVYCLTCSKLVNNKCGVCDKNIYVKKKNLMSYHLDIINGKDTLDEIKVELECDICYDTFIKDPDIIVKHPCSITYCENCTKLCSNFCKVCKNKISEKIIKHNNLEKIFKTQYPGTSVIGNSNTDYDYNKNWNAIGATLDYSFISSIKYKPTRTDLLPLRKVGNTIDYASFVLNN